MAAIQQLDHNRFSLKVRGSSMVLEQTKKGWRVKTTNAVSRVYSLGGVSHKDFVSLAEVEAHYKSWKGIALLLGSTPQLTH